MEEHRSTIVDPLVLSVLNRRSFKPSDFESEGEGTPVRFERGAMQWFIELFERRMRGRIQHPGRGQRLTWIQVIEEQVRQFARVLVAADEEYRPFVVRCAGGCGSRLGGDGRGLVHEWRKKKTLAEQALSQLAPASRTHVPPSSNTTGAGGCSSA